MKELKLNQDGTLNIVNPDKFYAERSMWRGIQKYYLIGNIIETNNVDNINHKYEYIDLDDMSCNFMVKFNDLQKTLTNDMNLYNNKIFQFDDVEEFIKCMQEGLI